MCKSCFPPRKTRTILGVTSEFIKSGEKLFSDVFAYGLATVICQDDLPIVFGDAWVTLFINVMHHAPSPLKRGLQGGECFDDQWAIYLGELRWEVPE